jgi:hypothetical protein|tara:strand:- start:21 stop:350 length:330 start_codon:yes stop_codon:yes gene_type:complete
MHSGITSKFMLAFEAPFSQGGFCKFDPAAIGRPKRRKGQKVDNDFFGWGGWGGSIWCWTSLEARHKVGFAYTMNGMSDNLLGGGRIVAILGAFRKVLHRLEEDQTRGRM